MNMSEGFGIFKGIEMFRSYRERNCPEDGLGINCIGCSRYIKTNIVFQ